MQVAGDDGVERLRPAAPCAWSWRPPASCPRSRREIRRATSAAISSHITMAWRWAFDLVTTVSSLRGRERASAKAKRMMRATPARVIIGDVGRRLLRQPAMHAPADARILALASSRARSPSRARAPSRRAAGSAIPGRMRVGRTLAYWSNGWQIASRRPQSETWSGTSSAPPPRNRWRPNPFRCVEPTCRHHHPVPPVVVRPPVEALERQPEAPLALGQRRQHLDPRRDHLLADPSPGMAAIR